MFAAQLKLLVLFVIRMCFKIDPIKGSLIDPNEECYFINKESKEKWKLVWQNNFQSEKYFKQNWEIEHEEKYCNDDWFKKSCNVRENVRLQNGCLVMSVKKEKHAQMEFTGAMLVTDRMFSYGRYEARVSLDPRVVSNFYTFTHAPMSIDGRLYIHRFENHQSWYKALFSGGAFVENYHINNMNYASFHLYGMEWSKTEVKFFVDNHYSEPIQLNDTRMVKPLQQIRFWFGVNSPRSVKPAWPCHLFIMDYVRVYAKVSNRNVGSHVQLCEEQNDVDQSSKKQRELVNSLCDTQSITQTSPVTQKVTVNISTTQSTITTIVHQPNISNHNFTIENASPFPWKSLWSNINSIVYVTFGIATLFFIARLSNRINKMKQQNASPPLDEIELENRHQYETISYDDVRETTF